MPRFLTRADGDLPATTEQVEAIRASCDALDRVQSLVVKDLVHTRQAMETGDAKGADLRRIEDALEYITALGVREKTRCYEADITRAEEFARQRKAEAAHGHPHGHHHH